VTSKAKHGETNAARSTNGKKRGVPPPPRNGKSAQSAGPSISIEKDFYAWLLDQSHAIRERRLEWLDLENIAEELEGMARKERHALTSHLRVMMIHLLKWAYQSSRRDRYLSSWRASILDSRQEIQDALEDSPSLGNEQNLTGFMQKAYRRARVLAAAEMGLSDRERDRLFPKECPWTFAQFMADGFPPEQQSVTASR
jgi:hypothetical protein